MLLFESLETKSKEKEKEKESKEKKLDNFKLFLILRYVLKLEKKKVFPKQKKNYPNEYIKSFSSIQQVPNSSGKSTS
jgi:hypothetical protein